MTNEQFTAALADKSAQLHVGLDNSTRVAFEAGAMWAKEVLEASPIKGTRPFQVDDKVKWLCGQRVFTGKITKVLLDTRDQKPTGYGFVCADFGNYIETFCLDGRKKAYDSMPSLFHID